MYGMLPHTMKQHFPPPKPAKFVNISPQTKSTTATTPAQSLESQVQWYFIVCIKKTGISHHGIRFSWRRISSSPTSCIFGCSC